MSQIGNAGDTPSSRYMRPTPHLISFKVVATRTAATATTRLIGDRVLWILGSRIHAHVGKPQVEFDNPLSGLLRFRMFAGTLNVILRFDVDTQPPLKRVSACRHIRAAATLRSRTGPDESPCPVSLDNVLERARNKPCPCCSQPHHQTPVHGIWPGETAAAAVEDAARPWHHRFLQRVQEVAFLPAQTRSY